MRVAVIGAGAAGLVTAHELGVEGHRVTVFERSRHLGGLWNYTDAVEDDPLGQRPSRRIHGSLYASMRVNLPRDLMAFEGYTFDDWVKGLYRQVVAVEEPSLAFIGLPFRIVPFPLFQRQARWLARSLAGRFQLPDLAGRRRSHCAEVSRLRSEGVAERHFHRLEDAQIDYMNRLAEQCRDNPVPDWFVALWREHNANARRHPKDYRDRPLQGGGPTVVP